MDILIIDDEKPIRDSTRIAVEAEGHYAESVETGKLALMRLRDDPFDLIFLDLRLGDESGLDLLPKILKIRPQAMVILFTAYASVKTAVSAIQKGAFDYLEKPFTPEQIRGILMRAEKQSRVAERLGSLENEVATLKKDASKNNPPLSFESKSPEVRSALDVLFRAAPTPATILILGDSGTGKSVIAEAIHQRSHLADKPFVTVSCPSLSKELLESELFGHVRGAFTGAVKDKWGKVQAASGGTLFLDEIGELPTEIQPKLLRLLQEREYERVGENKTRDAEVRVIAATNHDLSASVAEGDFREDLYYRLNVIAVEMPALHARPHDLLDFAHSYLDFFAGQIGRPLEGFHDDALAKLSSYHWPGNLRELRNVIERAVILSRGNRITADDLSGLVTQHQGHGTAEPVVNVGSTASLDTLEAAHIKQVIERSSTMKEAADILGINKATLYRKRLKLGME